MYDFTVVLSNINYWKKTIINKMYLILVLWSRLLILILFFFFFFFVFFVFFSFFWIPAGLKIDNEMLPPGNNKRHYRCRD